MRSLHNDKDAQAGNPPGFRLYGFNAQPFEPVKFEEIPSFDSAGEKIQYQPELQVKIKDAIQEKALLEKVVMSNAQLEAHDIVNRAKLEARIAAQEILQKAELEAKDIRTAQFAQGYEDGKRAALAEAQEDRQKEIDTHKKELHRETLHLIEKIKAEIIAIQEEKDAILQQQIVDMRDLTIAVAEKIINVSLRSSAEVIERMVMAAVEKSKSARWAKVYIAECDWEFVIKSDTKILTALERITDAVKLEILENQESGTCIIEFPDQVIDASVNTQLNQVRNLFDSANR